MLENTFKKIKNTLYYISTRLVRMKVAMTMTQHNMTPKTFRRDRCLFWEIQSFEIETRRVLYQIDGTPNFREKKPLNAETHTNTAHRYRKSRPK